MSDYMPGTGSMSQMSSSAYSLSYVLCCLLIILVLLKKLFT